MGIFSDALDDLSAVPSPNQLLPNPSDVQAYIKDAATKRGIDPNIALAVHRSEGGQGWVGDQGSSFGPYQLHYGGVAKGGNAVSGLGDTFTAQTGLDARNPATWRQQVDFALDQAKTGGWGPWHGWKGDPRAGMPQQNGYGPTYGGPTGAPRISIGGAPQISAPRDFAQSIPGGVVSGLSGILSASGQAAQAEMAQPIDVPQPQQINQILQQNVTGPLPEPQGSAGKYGRAIGEFLANAPFGPPIPGAGPVRTAAMAAAGGAASETFGQAAAGTPYENAARIAGPVVSGLLARRSTAPATEQQALKVGGQVANVPTTQNLLGTGAEQINAVRSGPIFSPVQQSVPTINAGGVPATKTVTTSPMHDLVSHIHNTMDEGGSAQYLAPKIYRAVEDLTKEDSVEGIQKVRSKIGGIAERNGGDEGFAGGMAKKAIDEYLTGQTPERAAALEEGRGNYAAGMRSKESDLRGKIAELKTNRAGYGGAARAVNAIKQTMYPVVKDYLEGKKNGLSVDEFNAMYSIVHGTGATNFLRGLGMISPEKGSVPVAILAETTKEVGPEVAAAIGAGSWLSNKLANVMTKTQINRLNDMIRKRSPLYEKAVKDAADKYTQSMNDFATNPSRASLVKALVASRNLSAGFRKDGIPLSSGDLLKGEQATDNNQGGENQ